MFSPCDLRDDHPASFLDIAVHRLTREQLNHRVREAVENRLRVVIANHNLHSLYLFHRDKNFRKFYKMADWVHADGFGIVLLSALSGRRLEPEHRTTYVDWMPDLIAMAAENGWRIFYIGSKPGIAAQGAAKLRREWPGLQIVTEHGYFDAAPESSDNRRLIRRIREYQPHILFVGMGMPRQERWIAENMPELECNVVLQAGAAVDYIAGTVRTPPRWTGRWGVEWLFRLMIEPRRLARRYLIEPWFVAWLVVRHVRKGFVRRCQQIV